MKATTFPDRPHFAIVGAGALGSYYGARLVQHGAEVHWLLRSDYEHLSRHGMRVESCIGDFALPPSALHVYRSPNDMPKVDIVLIALKTTANDQLPNLVTPLLHETTAVLALQNGLGNEQMLADVFGEERVLGGLAFVCINRVAPGEISHTAHGLIKIGEYHPGITPRLKKLSEIFNSSQIQCQMLENLEQGRWEKLIWNVPFNGLGAVMDLTSDRIVGSAAGLELTRELMSEIVTVAQAVGIKLDEALIEQNIKRTLAMGPYRSSMQIDRQLARPMEIEAIIGNPLRVAQAAGVKTQRLDMLYRQLLTLTGG